MASLEHQRVATLATMRFGQEERTVPDLRTLYEAHVGYVRALVTRLVGPEGDPEDLTHEVFLVAHDRLPTLRSAAVARSWLTSIALRVGIAARRRARLRRFVGLDRQSAEPLAAPARERPDRLFEDLELTRRVYAVLDKLSEKKRTVLILFEIQGLSGAEIAEAVGCPVETVWTRLHHARREFESRIRAAHAREPLV